MESIQNIVAGVFILMQGTGRLGQNELDFNDVLEVGTDVMRGFMRDAQLAHHPLRSMTAEATLDLDSSGVDYLVNVPTFPDFEPTALQYGINAANLSGWGDVNIVDLGAFPQFYNASDVYGAFYGSTATPEGLKLRTNMLDADSRTWQITFRLPLFAQLQLGDRPPLPVDFMRMVKLAWALACFPLVKKKGDEWKEFKRETMRQYEAELLGWNNPRDPANPGRWQEYLNGGRGSTCQAIPRYDDFRRADGMSNAGGVLGGGGAWVYRK